MLAIITNSGSTNAPASTLTINNDGSGSITYQKGRQAQQFQRYNEQTFPAGTFASSQLASILAQIKDVSTIPDRDCLKPISFGFTVKLTYQGKTSGDLTCVTNQDPRAFLDLKQLVLEKIYPRASKV